MAPHETNVIWKSAHCILWGTVCKAVQGGMTNTATNVLVVCAYNVCVVYMCRKHLLVINEWEVCGHMATKKVESECVLIKKKGGGGLGGTCCCGINRERPGGESASVQEGHWGGDGGRSKKRVDDRRRTRRGDLRDNTASEHFYTQCWKLQPEWEHQPEYWVDEPESDWCVHGVSLTFALLLFSEMANTASMLLALLSFLSATVPCFSVYSSGECFFNTKGIIYPTYVIRHFFFSFFFFFGAHT